MAIEKGIETLTSQLVKELAKGHTWVIVDSNRIHLRFGLADYAAVFTSVFMYANFNTILKFASAVFHIPF